ncbi:hypothetical protein Ciccas_013177 [Cichlidogyrus casuarinus]|uniref:Uncharacterized protein n=1 Tax=Cichlidogyrus casuarinus TaxID=1844966 RepID=A0ABD2PML2_9PLAT
MLLRSLLNVIVEGFCEVGPTADTKCCSPNVCNANERYGYCEACISNGNLCSKSRHCCDENCDFTTGRCVARKSCVAENAWCELGPTAPSYTKCCSPFLCNSTQRVGYCNTCISNGNVCSRDDECCDKKCDGYTSRCMRRDYCAKHLVFCEVGPTTNHKCCSPNVCNAVERYGYCQECVSEGNLCKSDGECCDKKCDQDTGRCAKPKFCASKNALCELHPTSDTKCCSPNVCNASKRYGYCKACISNGNLCSKNEECCNDECDQSTGRCADRR